MNSNIVPVVSAWTARQLTGFGLHPQPLAVKEGDELVLGRRRLRFIAYPSEAHLREGLLAYEVEDRVLFSSDLFMVRGREAAPVVKGEMSIVRDIVPQSIPAEEARRKCEETLDQLSIAIVAPGHGPVLDLRP